MLRRDRQSMVELGRQMLIGQEPFDRERIYERLWQSHRINKQALSDRNIAALDIALWDLLGRMTSLPVCKLLGRYRDRVKAYASTMCGDDMPGGLDSPQAYADFADQCREKGYQGFKLHTWMPPYGSDVKRDAAACRAVREAVGPDMHLMVDCHHHYTREEALYLGRVLEELGFHWMEEPLNEYNIASYVWLANKLDIPLVGPESIEGRMYTRVEWILRGATDVNRYDAEWHGGITAAMKMVHLCESLGVRLEIHGQHEANLQVLGAMSIPGEYYERGLLHPALDYEAETPWLAEKHDPLDRDGYVLISQKPGMGIEIDWDFIEKNTVKPWG